MPKALTTATFIARAKAVHGDRYDYAKTLYVHSQEKLTITCPEHGDFQKTSNTHLAGQGCPVCGAALRGASNIAASGARFAERASKVHDGKYTYEQAEYIGSEAAVTVTCAAHGAFSQIARVHLAGSGCPRCGFATSVEKRTKNAKLSLNTTEKVQQRLDDLHGIGQYKLLAPYGGSHTKLPILCKDHGEGSMNPNNIRTGNRLKCCRSARMATTMAGVGLLTTDEFVAQARAAHGDRYDYSRAAYTGRANNVTLGCEKHGWFEQRAGNHMNGGGCALCPSRVSKAESEIVELLRAAGLVVEQQASINGQSVDIYVPALKLAVEHNGEYWHGHYNPRDNKPQSPARHKDKQDAVEAAGVRLIQLWGTEWLNRRTQCERLLLNAAGVQSSRLAARKCQVVSVVAASAADFYDANHIQGAPSGGQHFGLEHDGALVACMTFSLTADRRGAAAKEQELKLVRYASSVPVTGGAGKLLAAGRAAFPGMPVSSFSDPRLFTGGMYAALGFAQVARNAPDYQVWGPTLGTLYHKSAFQRSRIEGWRVKLGRDDVPTYNAETDPRTEHAMQDALGLHRIYGVGLVKWVLE